MRWFKGNPRHPIFFDTEYSISMVRELFGNGQWLDMLVISLLASLGGAAVAGALRLLIWLACQMLDR